MDTINMADVTYCVETESFDDKELFYVTCDEPWSLVGMGETLERAKQDVRYEAKIILNTVSEDYPENLSAEGRRMVDHMLEIFEDPVGKDGNCRCSACRHDRGEL